MKRLSRVLSCAAVALGFALQAYAAGGSGDSTWQKDPSDWSVELYPVLGWGPSVHTNVTVPDHPGGPGLGNGTASSSLNGAAFVGFRVEKNKWSVQGNLLWAGLEADHSNPNANLGLDIIYGQALVGREVLPGLALEGGVRRLALDISASVANSPEVSRKPGITDPLVGMTYRKVFARKWRFDLHGDVGGFGAGSDISTGVSALLDWRFAKHFGVTMGYGLLYMKVSDTISNRTLTIEPLLAGPILGFGIFF